MDRPVITVVGGYLVITLLQEQELFPFRDWDGRRRQYWRRGWKFSKSMPESPGSGTSSWKDQGEFELRTLLGDDNNDSTLEYIPPQEDSLELSASPKRNVKAKHRND